MKSAVRVLDVLDYVCRRGNAAAHREITAALDIPKGSLSKLLHTMRARGYLAYDDATGMYALGPALFALYERARQARDAPDFSLPVLQWVTSVTGEASSYNVYRGDCVERICGVESDQPLGYRMVGNTRFTLHSSAAGKALLAALPDGEREAYFAQAELVSRTARTTTSVPELRRQVAAAAEQGVGISLGEHTPGVAAVAAVVRRQDGYPLGALNVVVPLARFTKEMEALCRRTLPTAVQRLEDALRDAGLRSNVPHDSF